MTRRGWCPSVFAPMQSGDGWLVRVKPFFSALSADAARVLASAALRHGSGVLELTNRGNVQVRGLSPNSASCFAAEMVAARLASPDPEVERRRNLLVSPLLDDDPAIAPDTRAVAEAIASHIETEPCFDALSDKFLVVVDGGGVLPLGGVRADIRLHPAGGDWRIERNTSPKPVRTVGCLPYAGGVRAAFGFGLPFGQMHASALAALATLAERRGDGTLRVTPYRAVLLAGIDPGRAAEFFSTSGLITDPEDPRLAIVACPGEPACASATVPTRADAGLLTGLGPVHLSGCAKGCAHPGPTRVTLVGMAGRYGIVRNGRASDTPGEHGLTLVEAVTILRREATA